MKHVFGPVPSRRLGNSLGVDLVVPKVCSYDCVYCQLGATTRKTTERGRFVEADEVIAEVERALAEGPRPDYVTLSGSGEPTLSLDLGRVVAAIKRLTAVPVAVLTNGSLLWREDVRAELAEADLVIPSLDAGTQATFERVNRPGPMNLGRVARGIRDFTLGFAGEVWLEVLVVKGVNDTPEEMRAVVRLLEGGRFERVHLHTVARAPSERWVRPTSEERLRILAAELGRLAPVEVVGGYSARHAGAFGGDVEAAILATLARRPCGAEELAASLGAKRPVVEARLAALERDGKVERVVVGGKGQFRLTKKGD